MFYLIRCERDTFLCSLLSKKKGENMVSASSGISAERLRDRRSLCWFSCWTWPKNPFKLRGLWKNSSFFFAFVANQFNKRLKLQLIAKNPHSSQLPKRHFSSFCNQKHFSSFSVEQFKKWRHAPLAISAVLWPTGWKMQLCGQMPVVVLMHANDAGLTALILIAVCTQIN